VLPKINYLKKFTQPANGVECICIYCEEQASFWGKQLLRKALHLPAILTALHNLN
jgi:hypothetical protein